MRINTIDEMIEALQEAKERLGLTGREQPGLPFDPHELEPLP